MQGKLLLQLETRTSNSLPVIGAPVENQFNMTQLENDRYDIIAQELFIVFSRRLRCEQTTNPRAYTTY